MCACVYVYVCVYMCIYIYTHVYTINTHMYILHIYICLHIYVVIHIRDFHTYTQDLRRDQLVISLIELMDMLLKREGVDLKIITYRVTATSHEQGLVQWV